MERPTKPVMWTDEEVASRFKNWLYARTNEWQTEASKLLDVTIDSLLHEINVVCPIGRLKYTSEWIDKILSEQKTMDILPTQYQCGYYELWDTDQKEVRGIVEVTQIEKLEMCLMIPVTDALCTAIAENYTKRCGFDCWQNLITYHRTHFQSIKYAVTYRIVDMKGNNNA